MGIFDWGCSAEDPYLECRGCGATVECKHDSCSNCGSDDIAVYHVD